PVAQALLAGTATAPDAARLVLVRPDQREYVALARALGAGEPGHGVTAVLGYSLDDALRPYREVAVAWLALLGLGLGIGLAGALLIARGVSRPIESLAATARRIEAGDYAPTPPVRGSDEIAQLDAALASMRRAIGEREERIRFQAGHDAVTGLPNRFSAEAAIGRQLAEAPGQPAALVTVGLPRMAEIVKTMGHAISDRVMQAVAARLTRAAGARQFSRVSDTSFAVFLPGAQRSEAIAFALRLLDALGDPYREADLAIDLAPAFGIALHPVHGETAPVLMQRAEVALFLALTGADPVSVYEPATDPHRAERLTLMSELRTAIEHDELSLHFQPKLDLATGRVDSVEALVRWTHERRGNVPPDAFVGLAEETGNVRRLTRWVLAAAIAQARRWHAAGHALRVAVNVSARDLDDSELPRRIADLLAAHALPAASLSLEVTESAVMARPDAAMPVLLKLAEMGVELSIDDFGVGQSSFAYLRRMPLGELKIDRSFVTRIAHGGRDRTIVRSIVELAHGLGYRVTAEGVEDAAALDCLREIGCDHAQGYFVARPMPADELDAFLARHAHTAPA
ncbi:MAG TPA: GGDEF domain-containing protein, partial [Xanthomonadales bacterium]|nr:GGDEF domain-containing protein [Xanthomonadales bacterium]